MHSSIVFMVIYTSAVKQNTTKFDVVMKIIK